MAGNYPVGTGVGGYPPGTGGGGSIQPVAIVSGPDSTVGVLLHGDASPVVDASLNALAVTTSGTVLIDSVNQKFGTGCLDFSGSAYVAVPNTGSVLTLGSSDFTIEAWINTTHTATTYMALVADQANYMFSVNSDGSLNAYWAVALSSTGVTLNDGAWHHVAWVREGSTHSLYADGARVATTTNTASISASNMNVANDPANPGSRLYTGLMDDLRFSVGIARYSGATYVVPVAPFSAVEVAALPSPGTLNQAVATTNYVYVCLDPATVAWQRYTPSQY